MQCGDIHHIKSTTKESLNLTIPGYIMMVRDLKGPRGQWQSNGNDYSLRV